MTDNGKLSSKQVQLVAALAQGMSMSEAAKRCQVAERTAYRWRDLPAFQQALQHANDEILRQSMAIWTQGMKKAQATLHKHMNAEVGATPASQVAATRIWIEQCMTTAKIAQLEQEIEELRAELGDRDL